MKARAVTRHARGMDGERPPRAATHSLTDTFAHDGAGMAGGVRDGGKARHLSAAGAAPCARAPGASRHAREGAWHLANVDVGRCCGRGARAGVRARRAGIPPGHASRHHWRQPAAPVLVDVRGAGVGRHCGAHVPGRPGRRLRLCVERCGDRVRAGRGPGAGRQDARGAAAGPLARVHLLRRSAWPAQLRDGDKLRAVAGAWTRLRPGQSGLFRSAGGRRYGGRRGDHAVHVGHHRQAQGCTPIPWRVHQRCDGRHRVRPVECCRVDHVVPAHGVGRRQSLFLRAMDGRGIHHQLPGVGRHRDDRPARDRPHVLLRAPRASSRTCSRR